MIKVLTINRTTWTAITTAGQQGTCWIQENLKGDGTLYISHSNTGHAPRSRTGLRLTKPTDNINLCVLGPDDTNDIYYARCEKAGSKIKICVDVN